MKNSGSATSVLIIDMHPSFRYGLRAFIDEQNDFYVVADNGDISRALTNSIHPSPNLIVLNPKVAGIKSHASLSGIIKAHPESRFLIATDIDDPIQVYIFLSEGAAGYIHKEAPVGDYINALRVIMGGGTYLPADLRKEVFGHRTRVKKAKNIFGLTNREIDLLQYINTGITNKELAAKLGISIRTVETHKRNIRLKCHKMEPAEILNYLSI